MAESSVSELTVLYAEQGNIAIITLNRPQALNSFTPQMHHDLWAALDKAEANRAIRAVVFTGAGRGFCAGADLAGFDLTTGADGVARGDPSKTIEAHFNPTARRLQNLRMPTVAAVNGVAAGAGASFVFGCDVAIASPSATFIQAFSKIGLIPDAGSTWFLPQRIGLARATAIAMTGDKISAARAKDWGMIWEVVEGGADDCLAAAIAMAQRLAAMPTVALVATRHILRDSTTRTFNQQLDVERDTQSMMGKTQDHSEGVKAFLEKRTPQFKGQ